MDDTDSILQGRVEVSYNGNWGTVCDDSWDLTDANVVCRELGYGPAVKAQVSSTFGRGKGTIWMDDVKCTGDERSLTECRHNGWGKQNCDHSQDAGVVCSSGEKKGRFILMKPCAMAEVCCSNKRLDQAMYHVRRRVEAWYNNFVVLIVLDTLTICLAMYL